MSFTTLGLSEPVLQSLQEQGYDSPTPIQKQAIPVILQKKDILAGAQTGTGKTAGFTLPLLEMLYQNKPEKGRPVRALILTPTRELAMQVSDSVKTYGRHLPLRSTVIFGGVGFVPQKNALRKGVDIVTATPGRLLDHAQQKTIDLSKVEYLILDEADRMLDMGFIHDIKRILSMMPKKRQSMLFSATFSKEIKKLADTFLHKPELIEVARSNEASKQVKQSVYTLNKDRKKDLLVHLITEQKWEQVLVFTKTKHGANRLSEALSKAGITSAAIHGNKSQSARTKSLQALKTGRVRVLVATDIAARGIDIDQLPHVVNYELPNVSEDYVHRIGRTGRAGNEGEAISLVCGEEMDYLQSIERLIKQQITQVQIKGFTSKQAHKKPPKQNQRGRGNRRRNANSRSSNSSGANRRRQRA